MQWQLLTDILIILTAALVLGTVAQQLRQSPLLGYLLAGTLVGPNGLQLAGAGGSVDVIAELGASLLLFTVGLEFSFSRLRRLGRIALIGGTLQVTLTLALATMFALAFGQGMRASIVIGAMIALSSTACVLRLLVDRAAIESVYGRSAVGILLLQDAAVIPLVLLVVTLKNGDSIGAAGLELLKAGGLAVLLIGGFYLIFNFVVPRLFLLRRWTSYRELPVLLAIVMALGSAAAAHAAGLSPAMGAFAAGVLLGESPFAVQIRADVGSLRTVLVTLFFAAIGMLGDFGWAMQNLPLVGGAVLAILAGKTFIVFVIGRLLGLNRGMALATGLCVCQVGEFSFVLGEIATGGTESLLSETAFQVLGSSMIVTLFLTPFLIAAAPRIAERFMPSVPPSKDQDGEPGHESHRLLIVGFGPAGQSVAEALHRQHEHIGVLDLNPRNCAAARRYGLPVHLGDATHRDMLEHIGLEAARVVVITIPDPAACRTIIEHCRSIAPDAAVVVRSRYHVHRWELQLAGAREVIDEEEHVGRRLAAVARRYLGDEPGSDSGND